MDIDTSSPSGLPNLGITYFANLERDNSDNAFHLIQEAEATLKDAEFPENWRELGQGSRGIGGILTTASYFVNCTEATFERTIRKFKAGRLPEIIPLHTEPLQGVMILRMGKRPNS